MDTFQARMDIEENNCFRQEKEQSLYVNCYNVTVESEDMTKYKASRDIVQFARDLKTLSPSKIAEQILSKRNKKVTQQSVTMWLKRHAKVYDMLSAELVDSLPSEKQQVDANIFQNGQFTELPSIKNWIVEMQNRDLKENTINNIVGNLRQVCKNQQNFEEWCMKHPDRLTLNEAMQFVALCKKHKRESTGFKAALKNFLMSKGIVVGKKIAVGKHKSFGRYAELFCDMETIKKILDHVKRQSFEAYVADRFMLMTATRISATLRADIKHLNRKEKYITVFDKGRRVFKKWKKYLSDSLLYDLDMLIGGRKHGEIFNITKKEITLLNSEAIQKYAVEMMAKYPSFKNWNHFWRHMFAQHMLRATKWNYAAVAKLGGWTIQALQESYGEPPDNIVKEWGISFANVFT